MDTLTTTLDLMATAAHGLRWYIAGLIAVLAVLSFYDTPMPAEQESK